MNSEKVKKIKKVLEQNTKTCLLYDFGKNTDCKVFQCKYILDYINELESELKEEQISSFNCNTLLQLIEKENQELKAENETIKFNMQETEKASFNINQMNGNLVIENQQLKNRIAELEKEKEETMKAWFEDREGMFWDGVGEGKLKCYKQLKQFAERLKKKIYSLWSGRQLGELLCDIDETLKEFIE